MIYTVGYEQLSVARLVHLAEALDAKVIDVRGIARSRKPGFAGTELARMLGDRYEWRGDRLGNRGDCRVTEAGLDELEAEAENVLLLCLEHAPGDCHRHHLIGVPLGERGVEVHHICDDELVEALELERSILEEDDYYCTSFEV